MGSLLDHPLLSARYFFPRKDKLKEPLFVPSADGSARLACYRAAPFDEAPTLLHFHGNAEVVADYVPTMAALFNGLGVNVFFAEYRGYGESTGSPSLNAMLDDAEAVYQAVGAQPRNIVAFGRSLGSLFAVEVCARHPDIAGLVIESGIADPLERTLVRVSAEDLGTSQAALEQAVRARVDQRAKLAGFRNSLLVLHTASDTLIAPSHAERIAEWGGAPSDQKKLVIFDEGDHGTIFPSNRDAYLAHVGAFLGRTTRPRHASEAAPIGSTRPPKRQRAS